MYIIWLFSFNICKYLRLNSEFLFSLKVIGQWSAWGGYSNCTKTCGGGRETRTRSCINPASSGEEAECLGSSTDSRDCNTNICNGMYDPLQIL